MQTVSSFLTEDELYRLWNTLQKVFKPDLKESSLPIRRLSITESTVSIICNKNIDKIGDLITNYFIEEIRIQARRKGKPSPLEVYMEKPKTFDKSLNILDNYYQKRRSVEKCLSYSFCDTFPWSVAMTIFSIFKPKSVLDMSAGWGDRLCSAYACGVNRYVGVDPNTALFPCYQRMIKMFSKEGTNYQCISSPFEDVDIEKLSPAFDMMFSSPPYFDAEQYSSDPEQSSIRYPTREKWLKYFMYPSIDKIWKVLKNGGFFILVLNDIEGEQYTFDTINYIKSKEGCIVYKLMKYIQGPIRQPIWIFQKLQYPKKVSFLDPIPSIKPVRVGNRTFSIIREDLLPGGSKQRVVYEFLSTRKENDIFYRGPVNGYAQVAIAYGCQLLGKKCHLILNRQYTGEKYKVSLLAQIFGATIHEIDKPSNEKEEQEVVDSLVSDGYRIPLGFAVPEVEKAYPLSKLRYLSNLPIQRIWMVASSGVLYRALYTLLPDTEFHIILVGHRDLENFYIDRTKIYYAPENFREDTKVQPPYPTQEQYDAKVWRFVLQYGRSGDFVLNVGGF